MVRAAALVALVAGVATGGCAVTGGDGGSGEGTRPAPAPLAVVLDSSGSMALEDAPGPRIDAARGAVRTLLDALPEDSRLGLVTYGADSREEDGPDSCGDISVAVDLGPVDRTGVEGAVDALTPGGWTPIGRALETAAGLLPADGSDQQIVLVSDGESTCEPPPCEVARRVAGERPGLTISAIGFRSDAEELSCIATAGRGLYVTADNAPQLAARLAALGDLEGAESALTPRSVHGIEVGASLAAIREAFPDFPETGERSPDGERHHWRETEWTFLDGLLVGVAPADGRPTIDGVTVGTAVARLLELYGDPVAWSEGPDGDAVATFAADPDLGTVWRITTTSREVTGTVRRVELRRGTPSGPADGLMELVAPDGRAEPYGRDWRLTDTPARFRPTQVFARSRGLVTSVHGDTNSALRACWREDDSSAVCTTSVRERLLFRVPARYDPAPGLDDGAGPAGRGAADALAVVLEDGRVCDTVGYAGGSHRQVGTRTLVSAFLCGDGDRLWRDLEETGLPPSLPVSGSADGGHGDPSGGAEVAGYVLPLDTDASPR